MLLWAIRAIAAEPNTVTADNLASLKAILDDAGIIESGFNYTNLSNFMNLNYACTLQGPPDDASDAGAALFPACPALTLEYGDGTNNVDVDFATTSPVDASYQEKIDAYFAALQAQFAQDSSRQADSPAAGVAEPAIWKQSVIRDGATLLPAQTKIELVPAFAGHGIQH